MFAATIVEVTRRQQLARKNAKEHDEDDPWDVEERETPGKGKKKQGKKTTPKKAKKTSPKKAKKTKNAKKTSPKNAEKTSPKNAEKTSPIPKNAEKTSPKSAEKTSPKNAEKTSVKNAQKTSPKNAEKTSVKNAEKISVKNAEKTSVKNAEKTKGASRKKGNRKGRISKSRRTLKAFKRPSCKRPLEMETDLPEEWSEPAAASGKKPSSSPLEMPPATKRSFARRFPPQGGLALMKWKATKQAFHVVVAPLVGMASSHEVEGCTERKKLLFSISCEHVVCIYICK